MRDEWLDTAFEAELRAAMRLELATVRVGVAAPQVRGRIAARDRGRRTMRLVLLAAGLAAALLGGLVLAGRFLPAPPPGAAEPATVAAIDPSTGDLVVSRAWPDGRLEAAARYPGALGLLRGIAGYQAATDLPHDAVATGGADGRLAVALPDGAVLVFPRPAEAGDDASIGFIADGFTAGWLGWTTDGLLARAGETHARLLDPATGVETAVALPERVIPEWTRGETQLLTWTSDGRLVARQGDPATFQSVIGTLDLGSSPATFTAGLPGSVRRATGLEPRYAADGTSPGAACQDQALAMRCAGIEEWSSNQGIAPRATWYVAREDEALTDTVRTADGEGLLVVARTLGPGGGRLLVVDAPGMSREAFAFDAPAYDVTSQEAYLAGRADLVGVAPGGRSVALRTPGGLVIGDLEAGTTATIPTGAVFVGWAESPAVATASLPTVAPCEPATTADGAEVVIAAGGATSPASAGASPVVGGRQDADPFRTDELAAAPALEAAPGGFLALALPGGACAEAAIASAVPAAGGTDETPLKLGAWPAGNGVIGGLVPVVAPPEGDWIVRVQLWLDGAEREAILLYRVRVDEP